MNVIDLMVTIVVVTILVTLILAVVTYIAYKLRLAREPSDQDQLRDGLRYFVKHEPPARPGGGSAGGEGHASDA